MKNAINIRYDGLQYAQVTLVNILGETIILKTFPSGSKNEIDVSTIADGIYVLKIYTGIHTMSKKIIIHH